MDESSGRLPRVVDVALASAGLVLAAPAMALIAIAILVDSGRPVMLVQERLGRGCVPFGMHKFRTLRVHAGDRVTPVGDPRVTRVGAWLRRTRLDELPQLWDVLRGAMALVGPRPEVPANVVAVPQAELARLLLVRPGLTGPTQLAFCAEDELLADVEDPTALYRRVLVPAKVAHELAARGERSAWRDLGVLLRTPFTVASRRGRARSRAFVGQVLARAGALTPAPRAATTGVGADLSGGPEL